MWLTVAICSRNRPRLLAATLAALERQTDGEFELLVVDQSPELDPQLERLRERRPGTLVLRDPGVGLSRARNRALAVAKGSWLAFVDDDCLAAEDCVAVLKHEIAAHPEADWISGDVRAGAAPEADYLPVTTFPVERGVRRRGRWAIPGAIGFGVFFCVRRELAERLGGWDERLGPGVPEFPAADDMDFNHRLLRAGGTAWLSPRVRLRHDQWRSQAELRPLQRGYVRAWSGFAMKQVRAGHPLTGLWLWSWGALDVLDMAADALRRRSRLRGQLALAKARGLCEGTALGLSRRW